MEKLIIDKENNPKVGDKVVIIYKTDINATISSRAINSIVVGTLDYFSNEEPYAIVDGIGFDLANEGETSSLLKLIN